MRERIAVFLCEFLFFYRAENLCYQFRQGQELKPQFRKIVCLVSACFARKRILENLVRYTCANLYHFPSGRLPRLRSQ